MILMIFDIGSEFDFVIFSTMRSMLSYDKCDKAAVQPDRAWIRAHLGFVTDRHLGITRTKHGLIITGKLALYHLKRFIINI